MGQPTTIMDTAVLWFSNETRNGILAKLFYRVGNPTQTARRTAHTTFGKVEGDTF